MRALLVLIGLVLLGSPLAAQCDEGFTPPELTGMYKLSRRIGSELHDSVRLQSPLIVLEMDLNESGRVDGFSLLPEQPRWVYDVFSKYLIRARFKPATECGVPVPITVKQRFFLVKQ